MLVLILLVASVGAVMGIRGGSLTTIDKYPYTVSIGFNKSDILNRKSWSCAGSIISPEYVLTTAQCAAKDVGGTLIRSGSSVKTVKGTVHTVKRVIKHHEYDPQTLKNNIALIQVSDPKFDESLRIKLADLWTPIDPSTRASVCGWGNTNRFPREDLAAIDVNIVDKNTCAKENPNPGEFCASKVLCDSDHGNPLVIQGPKGPLLIGLASWTDSHPSDWGCRDSSRLDKYIDVNYYRQWIQTIVNPLHLA